MKWIFSGIAGLIIMLALYFWQPKRHDTTLVVPDEPKASVHGKVREDYGMTIEPPAGFESNICFDLYEQDGMLHKRCVAPLQVALAEEIARENGFYRKGTIANTLHNPGELSFLQTKGAFQEWIARGSSYAEFPSDESGWAALHAKVAAEWDMSQHAAMCDRENHIYFTDAQTDARVAKDCTPEAIAYDVAMFWQGHVSKKRAADIIARLKKRGLLK